MEKDIKRGNMMKLIALLTCFILIDSCTYKHVTYQPDTASVSNPKATIRRVLESQPPNVVPLYVEVTNEYIKVIQQINQNKAIAAAVLTDGVYVPSQANPIPTTVYYSNIGKIKLFKKKVYCVNIYAKGGQLLLWAYAYEESQAKGFINALNAMKEAEPQRAMPKPSTSSGTGFAVTPDGFILTANHIVKSAKSIIVTLNDGRSFNAEVWIYSGPADLAVLRVDSSTPNYLTLISAKEAKLGESIFTMGFPMRDILGKDPKYTEGSVSALSGLGGEMNFFQISIPIQPGNSGGPVVNMHGQVIGVVTSTAAIIPFLTVTGSLPQNINWAVKSDYALSLFNEPPPLINTNNREEAIDRVIKALCSIETVQ